ncbi:MAG: hypothetical protein NTV29_19375 [Planctomycetota bacterium]|nr:hypothetical protein [Planctomycetota bacterium]
MSTQSEQQRDRWNTMVVPAAKGLERFFWNLAWFCVLLMVLLGGPCIRNMQRPIEKGELHQPTSAEPAP